MRDYKLYLSDIKEAAEKIETFTRGMNFEQFKKDSKTIDAVIRNLEIIGEASRHIPQRIKTKYKLIDWQAIIGMRNIIAHEYFGVALGIIWKTVQERVPELNHQVEEILRET